jgi:hypothetical protein
MSFWLKSKGEIVNRSFNLLEYIGSILVGHHVDFDVDIIINVDP